MCNFLEYKDTKIVYRRYASLFFIAGCDSDDNELITLEVIHRYVEQMDKYYGNVCELDIIFSFTKAYYILDELLLAGELQESSKKAVLRCIGQQDSLEDMEVSPVACSLFCHAAFPTTITCAGTDASFLDSGRGRGYQDHVECINNMYNTNGPARHMGTSRHSGQQAFSQTRFLVMACANERSLLDVTTGRRRYQIIFEAARTFVKSSGRDGPAATPRDAVQCALGYLECRREKRGERQVTMPQEPVQQDLFISGIKKDFRDDHR